MQIVPPRMTGRELPKLFRCRPRPADSEHLLGLSVTLVISVSDAATSRSASCDSVRGRPTREGVPPTPPPRGPSIRSVCRAARRRHAAGVTEPDSRSARAPVHTEPGNHLSTAPWGLSSMLLLQDHG